MSPNTIVLCHSLEKYLGSSSAPFLIMGRVTYLHHYVCLACVLWVPNLKSFYCFFFLATNAIFLRPDAFARPRSFHFLFKTIQNENQEHCIRCAGAHRYPQFLVVQRSCFRNRWTYWRTQGAAMAEGNVIRFLFRTLFLNWYCNF